ncbi:hypothetical protein [Paenibacillus sp. FSL W7-1287]|uniref:hypothetical protein n=1 Tax=Paenibacillus sp. FSL W7-1287 TaxID=2954538 RepID=UPI0030F9A573
MTSAFTSLWWLVGIASMWSSAFTPLWWLVGIATMWHLSIYSALAGCVGCATMYAPEHLLC